MTSFNPLFEREWQGRFRHPSSHLLVALLSVVMTALVCSGVWRSGFLPGMTPDQWRQNGHLILDNYRAFGAPVFWGMGLLMGAACVAKEKEDGTWEELLLCPLEGKGLVGGKLSSNAAYALLLQSALFPVLIVAGQCFGATPLEIGSVMLSHLLLTLQGVTLGVWGSIRERSLIEGLIASVIALVRLVMHGALAMVAVLCIFLIVGMVLYLVAKSTVPLPFVLSISSGILGRLVFIIQSLASLVGGVTGIGVAIRTYSSWGHLLSPPLLLAGQLLGIGLMLKWSAWQVDYPTRNLGGSVSTAVGGQLRRHHLRILYGVWSWTLTREEVKTFPLRERTTVDGEPEREVEDLPSQLLARRKNLDYQRLPEPPGEATQRLRFPVALSWSRLNPVLWLDLTRVLSLRVPDAPPSPVRVLLVAPCIAFLMLWSFGVVLGWNANAQFGSAGAKVELRQSWESFRWVLLSTALVCGPLWGARGYMAERRSELLLELRLTLLSAGAVVWGKFAARFIAFILCTLPLLALVLFFFLHWPGKDSPVETVRALLSSWLLATWSLLACLCISDVFKTELAATVGCGAFAFAWGALIWEFPDLPWNLSHLVGAVIASWWLIWRLKRLGFG